VGGPGVAPVSPYTNIQFEFDSSVLKTSSYPVLDASSADLKANSSVVTLAGYASSEGTAAHNLRLSRDRAISVRTYLVNSGVDAKRLKIKAYGETHPIADNTNEDGRVLNRRVEFHR
jgi:OOP family OmpA-OmpF porin